MRCSSCAPRPPTRWPRPTLVCGPRRMTDWPPRPGSVRVTGHCSVRDRPSIGPSGERFSTAGLARTPSRIRDPTPATSTWSPARTCGMCSSTSWTRSIDPLRSPNWSDCSRTTASHARPVQPVGLERSAGRVALEHRAAGRARHLRPQSTRTAMNIVSGVVSEAPIRCRFCASLTTRLTFLIAVSCRRG